MSRTSHAPLVGRDAETEWLLAAVERALARRAGTAFITGDAGIGKTRLARSVADEAARRGFVVAEGRAFAAESGLPYAILADALLPHLRRLDSATLTLLTRGAGGDLAAILPSLFAPGVVNAAEGAAERKARMFWSLTEMLVRLAARQPLLLVLDNLQWADPSSLELLHFVSRQLHASPKGAPLLIVCTCVDTERERHAGVRTMIQSLVGLGAAEVRRLSALSLDQAVELVSRQFDTPQPTVRRLASLLHEWTRGNPFYIEETLKSLVERGRLRPEGDAWRGWDEAALTPPNSVREVVLGRVERLGERARALLEVAAVLGARVTLASLRQASGLAGDELADALEELRGAAFLIEDASTATYDFAHPLVRDSVYASLGRARAQLLHDRIATAFEELYGSDAVAHAAELAHHLVRGSDGTGGERAARYLGEAGRQALARHADRAAVEYLEAAVATGQRDDSYDLLEPLAIARQRVGDVAGAVALWGRLREAAMERVDARHAAMVERRLGLIASSTNEHSVALRHFDAGLELIASRDENDLRVRLLLARANTLQTIGRRDDALIDARSALEAASTLGEPALLARVHRALLLLHVWTGPAAEAHAHGLRAVELAVASGERAVEWSAHWAMAIHGGLTGDAPSTAYHLAEARRLADEIRSPVLRLWTADVAIEYLSGTGEWHEALAIAAEAIPAARALGQRTLLPRLLVWTSLIHRGLGDLEQARVLIDEAWSLAGGADDASAMSDVHAAVPVHTGMAGYRMTAGDNAGALAVGEAGLAIADRTGYMAWAVYRLLPFIIETALYLEDYDRAARYNARLRRDSLALGHALGLAWADTTDALLIYLRGDPVRAVPLLRAATAALEQVPFVFDAARLRRLVARALLDAGDEEGAERELREAHEIFVRLGAAREMRATREQLRAIGARVPLARRHDGAGALSAREGEIARLVAARKSNKEIGVALDISSRTVSTHLSNIFQKLGVSSRGELTDLVRAGGLEGKDA